MLNFPLFWKCCKIFISKVWKILFCNSKFNFPQVILRNRISHNCDPTISIPHVGCGSRVVGCNSAFSKVTLYNSPHARFFLHHRSIAGWCITVDLVSDAGWTSSVDSFCALFPLFDLFRDLVFLCANWTLQGSIFLMNSLQINYRLLCGLNCIRNLTSTNLNQVQNASYARRL